MNTRKALALLAASGLCLHAEAGNRNVAVVVHEGAELLDFAGPAEVFDQAGYRVYTVAHSAGPIASHGAVTVLPRYTIADCPHPDILVVPGGDTPVLTKDPEMMAWIKSAATDATIAMSVCTGAFTFAENGLLDGQKATTHFGAIAALKRNHPKIEVLSDQRFVDNGKIVTTAGISAGIDGALHVVARLEGEDVAWQCARSMEYRWEPPQPEHPTAEETERRAAMRAWVYRDWPEAARLYEKLNAAHPDDAKTLARLGESLMSSGKEAEGAALLEKAVSLGFADGRALRNLARAQLGENRNSEAIATYERAFAAGLDDRGTSRYNLACAYSKSGQVDRALENLTRAVDDGFSNRGLMETDEDLAACRNDARFKALLERMN